MTSINEWKRIPSFPNYSVSKDGQVRRIRPSGLKGVTNPPLKPFVYKEFVWYWLYRNGVRHKIAATRLVASAFLEATDDLRLLEVQMIDPAAGCYYTNLRYVYRKLNPRKNEAMSISKRRYYHHKRYG